MSEVKAIGGGHGDVYLEGSRTGVLLIHGLGGTPAEMRLIAQGLHRQGHTVLCPMLRGHGGSDLLLSTTRWEQWLETVQTAYAQLAERCDHIVIGGQSAGGMLAIHLAAEKPANLAGLVLFSPTFWPNGWAIPRHFQLFRLIRQRFIANLIRVRERAPFGIKDERLRKLVIESLQREGRSLEDIHGRRGGTIFEFRKLARSAKQQLSAIAAPVLVMHSRIDDQADLSNAMRAVCGLKAPTELVVLDDSYHLITLDHQRMFVMDRTVTFAKSMFARLDAKAVREQTARELMTAANEQ
ncbi:MAG: alpha/beta fold hydrolase [Pseudomonadota bacterium]